MLSADIKYTMRDLICDVISYCASSYAMEKLSVGLYDHIVIENSKTFFKHTISIYLRMQFIV